MSTSAGEPASLPLASYKIDFETPHVRAMPGIGLDGATFTAPGVDLRGADALEVIAASSPIVDWLDAREPGVEIRSISIDTRVPRVVVSLNPTGGATRQRVVRFETPHADELRLAGAVAERVIGAACLRVLRRRA